MENLLFSKALETGIVVVLSVFAVIIVSRITSTNAANNQTNMNSLLDLLHDMVKEFNNSLKELNNALNSLREILSTTNHTIERQYVSALGKLDELRSELLELHKNIDEIKAVTKEIKAEAPTKIK